MFTFWETPPGQPKALRAWFYPGDNFGQEFAYPKSAAVQIAAVIASSGTDHRSDQPAELPKAEVTQTQPSPAGSGAEYSASGSAGSCSGSGADSGPRLAAPQELPKTASPYPLIGLAGIFSLGLFALVRAFRLS